MNTPLLLGWGATFLATVFGLWKWNQKREHHRRVAKGLRAYTTGVQLG
jgi:hypothetical protein